MVEKTPGSPGGAPIGRAGRGGDLLPPVALISFAYRGLMHVPRCGPCKSALCALMPVGSDEPVERALHATFHANHDFLYFMISFGLFQAFLFEIPCILNKKSGIEGKQAIDLISFIS